MNALGIYMYMYYIEYLREMHLLCARFVALKLPYQLWMISALIFIPLATIVLKFRLQYWYCSNVATRYASCVSCINQLIFVIGARSLG